MADRYDGMSHEELQAEAKRRGLNRVRNDSQLREDLRKDDVTRRTTPPQEEPVDAEYRVVREKNAVKKFIDSIWNWLMSKPGE